MKEWIKKEDSKKDEEEVNEKRNMRDARNEAGRINGEKERNEETKKKKAKNENSRIRNQIWRKGHFTVRCQQTF